jgi:hypothetical protein
MTSTRPRPYRSGQVLGVPGGVCVVVISCTDSDEDLVCAGETLVAERPVPCSAPGPSPMDGVRPGDVLWDPVTGLEIRCIRGGRGPLLNGGRTMVLRSRDRLSRPRRPA